MKKEIGGVLIQGEGGVLRVVWSQLAFLLRFGKENEMKTKMRNLTVTKP